MKNLLIFMHPSHKFSDEAATLARIQIDNSYCLGWKKEDIFLVTNFPYEYNGIASLVVKDDLFCSFDPTNKIPTVTYLFSEGLIDPNEMYWYHDFDAYQNNVIEEDELGLAGIDLGLTTYGYKNQWNGGSFFFKQGARDMVELWDSEINKHHRHRSDELTLTDLTRAGRLSTDRYKELNISYNFGQRHTEYLYERAIKPLKVLHFHPYYTYYRSTTMNIRNFMYGENGLGMPLMTERLIGVFRDHGFQ